VPKKNLAKQVVCFLSKHASIFESMCNFQRMDCLAMNPGEYEDEVQDADRAGRPSEVYHHRYFWIRSNSFSTLTTSMSDSNIGD